jgi:hypothetical protein
MINLKDIVNRVYENKIPVAFEVNIPIEGTHGEPTFQRVWFEKLSVNNEEDYMSKLTYKVFTIIGNQVYELPYLVPRQNLPLETVVTIGLNQLQALIQDEAIYKQVLASYISQVTEVIK